MARFITVDFSGALSHREVHMTGEQMFLAIRSTYLAALAMDRRKRDIEQVVQMRYHSYDPSGQMLTIELPPGFSEPTQRLVKELAGMAYGQDLPVRGFYFVPSSKLAESDGRVIVERPQNMVMKKTNWLWMNYIPLGRITILAGDPGIGKSQTSIDLVARITRGDAMPDGSKGMLGNCGIVTAEDETSETIMPRLVAAQADMRKVRVIRKVKVDGNERYLSLPRDLNRLRTTVHNENLKLLIIDPLNAFVEIGVNTYKDQDIRSVLAPVEGMAEELGCSVLIIAHLNKKEDAATLYRVGGSIGFVGAARSVLAVQLKKNTDDVHVLYSLKSNLARKPPAQQFEIVGAEVTEASDGETIKTSKVEWLGQCSDPNKVTADVPMMEMQCLDFLIEMFSGDFEVPAKDVRAAAKEAGIAWRTLAEYKPKFKVDSIKRHGQWYWKAPENGFRQFKKK